MFLCTIGQRLKALAFIIKIACELVFFIPMQANKKELPLVVPFIISQYGFPAVVLPGAPHLLDIPVPSHQFLVDSPVIPTV